MKLKTLLIISGITILALLIIVMFLSKINNEKPIETEQIKDEPKYVNNPKPVGANQTSPGMDSLIILLSDMFSWIIPLVIIGTILSIAWHIYKISHDDYI
jgi:hypothetical protein